ncbi:1546_t:CDS:2 [Gigaspora margarita]|uniref:1546_t:CDS:1 n=1 Tax=Gigaspora margarita TaxID=4874 RepID=A0ABM8W4K9_GIGMA|nr:1546_t:CDS:2 [Gigaspora margarita]
MLTLIGLIYDKKNLDSNSDKYEELEENYETFQEPWMQIATKNCQVINDNLEEHFIDINHM